MENSKLLAAFKALDRKELKRFQKFVYSPYHNEHKGLMGLCDYLASLFPNYETDKLGKEHVFRSIFGNEPFDDLKLRHLSSDLLKLVEQFLAVEGLSNEKYIQDDLILKWYRRRSLDKHFNAKYRTSMKRLNDSTVRDDEYYWKYFSLESEMNKFLGEKYIRKGENNVQNAASALDKFFIINKLSYGCTKLNYSNVFDKKYELFLFDEILNHVEEKGYENDDLIKSYFYLYKSFIDESEKDFFTFKELLISIGPRLNLEQGRELYTLAANYCIKKINKGYAQYFEELFNFYKLGIERKMLFSDSGELSPFKFKNIVVVACRLEQFEWAENFINDHHSDVPNEHRQNSLTFNLALLNWFRKDYKRVLRLISQVDFEDPFYALDTKTILLKIYFENGEYDALMSHCDSFRIYVRRNKLVSESHRTNHLNLIKYALRLMKITDENKDQLQMIKQEIASQKDINNRKWLLDQIAVMEANMAG